MINRKEYLHNYYQKNRDRILEQERKYREENKEFVNKRYNEWYQINKEKIHIQRKICRKKNKEKIKERYNEHREQILEQKKQYYQKNRQKILEYQTIYREKHKEEISEKYKSYIQTENGKKVIKRLQTKRRRNLGYAILNKKFPNSEGHHIDKDHVIFIPQEMHRSFYYNLKRPETMIKINLLALEYLTKDWNNIKIEELIT